VTGVDNVMDLFLADGANGDGTPKVVMLNLFQHLSFPWSLVTTPEMEACSA
jgi:hypothetical protein